MLKEKYISIPEAAKILGISRIAVYKKVKAGKIKAIRVGRNYAIPQTHFQEILGTALKENQKETVKKAVKRVVTEYGDVLKRLGRE